MGQSLKEKLKQNTAFHSKAHEAMLSLMVAAVHVRRKSERVLRKHGLSFTYYNVLRILRGAPSEGYPRCEIISRMIDPAPDVTRLIDQLVVRGWVQRERSDQDRRVSLHWITDDGNNLLAAIDHELDNLSDEFATQIPEDDLDQLIRICSVVFTEQVQQEEC
jgi:DNA-binding MarR family transcriptional regulator